MTTYRMAMRAGSRGQELWPLCFSLGVAAITYEPLSTTNLSLHSPGEPAHLWDQLHPTQKASLSRLAYQMKEGDVIFVKQGPKIVGRGNVTALYDFDHAFKVRGVTIEDEFGTPWPHQVPVKWDTDFIEVDILLGSEQLTVKKLELDDVKRIGYVEQEKKDQLSRIEAEEGKVFKAETNFRVRNRTLINIKKMQSPCICEVCGFSYEQHYGEIGRGYIIAHHLKLVATGPTTTTLDDIALVCANCHAMIHSKNPPIPISDMRHIVMGQQTVEDG